MPTLQINGKKVTVAESATLLEAAHALDITIPTLCWRKGLPHVTSCMLCVVEDRRTGTLYPACSRPAENDMQIATDTEAVLTSRRTALELLLSDHLGDCEGPCRRACMAGMDIPRMLRLIASNDLQSAIPVIKQHIPLPAVLGRICPAPCEKICRRGQADAPVSICLLKRYVADADLSSPSPFRPETPPPSGFHVAIVGAGPAGLSAAYALLRKGHACTILEKENKPGGGLRSPELAHALPKEILEAEIAQISLPGLNWRYGETVGKTITLETLKQQFDAVVIAWGKMPAADLSLFDLKVEPQGLAFDRKTFVTSDPKIFACGNAIAPGHLAVRATGQGVAAATTVDQFLGGQPLEGIEHMYDHRIPGKLDAEEMTLLMDNACPENRIIPTAGFTTDEAIHEAKRCLHCECRKPHTCQLRKQAQNYDVDQRTWRATERRSITITRRGNITYEPGKCIACGICVRLTTAANEPLGLTYIGRGFDVRIGVPFGETLEKGLGRVAAECVAACPTGALAHTTHTAYPIADARDCVPPDQPTT